MSNLGFVQAMEAAGITVIQTAVGDRYVLEAMRAGGFNLGGEQSGHVIMSDHATTGDGVLTALSIAARVVSTGRPLSDLAAVMHRLPQVLVNVPQVDKSRATTDPTSPPAEVALRPRSSATPAASCCGRPGTEPLVRVMVEAATSEQAETVALRLAAVVGTALAL